MLTPLSRPCSTLFQGFWLYSCQSSWPSLKKIHPTYARNDSNPTTGESGFLLCPQTPNSHGYPLSATPFHIPHSLPPHRPSWWPTVSKELSQPGFGSLSYWLSTVLMLRVPVCQARCWLICQRILALFYRWRSCCSKRIKLFPQAHIARRCEGRIWTHADLQHLCIKCLRLLHP